MFSRSFLLKSVSIVMPESSAVMAVMVFVGIAPSLAVGMMEYFARMREECR
jgi:hypothetical protein